jgi:glycosyltransferase involved in cell wall biosynthesis
LPGGESNVAKILWSINTLTEVDSQVFPEYLISAYRLGRDTEHEMVLHTPRRMPIASARNNAVEFALSMNCDYVFFSDDDMVLHPKTLPTLLSRDKDIIMAMSYIRGYPFKPMVFKWFEGEEMQSRIADVKVKGKAIGLWSECEEHIDENGLINNVAAVGCPATLVKTELFRKMDYPWFYTGTANTEDVYFCIKAQQADPGVSIAVDTTVPAGHLLKDKRVLFPKNAELLRKHEDELKEFTVKELAK